MFILTGVNATSPQKLMWPKWSNRHLYKMWNIAYRQYLTNGDLWCHMVLTELIITDLVSACRHCENFLAFTAPRRDFGLILRILNTIIHKSFTSRTHVSSANVWGLASFLVSGLVTYSWQSNCLNQCRCIFNWTLRKKLQWILIKVWTFHYKNALKNVVKGGHFVQASIC